MALVGVELETLVFEPDAQTTRPPHSVSEIFVSFQSIHLWVSISHVIIKSLKSCLMINSTTNDLLMKKLSTTIII